MKISDDDAGNSRNTLAHSSPELVKEYHSPELVEYGALRELTLGSTGPKGDSGAGGFGKEP